MTSVKITKHKTPVICILGMHRSGTSLLTRLLNLSGLEIGEQKNIYDNHIGNEKGHWENIEFIKINEEIIKIFGKTDRWDDIPFLYEGWQNSKKLKRLDLAAKKLINKFDNNYKIWGWKDPRTCLTLSFWQKHLQDRLIYIIPLRNPIDIAKSLYKRNSLPIKEGVKKWQIHTDNILRLINNRVVYVDVNNFFTNPEKELSKILNKINSPLLSVNEKTSKNIREFITPEIWHFKSKVSYSKPSQLIKKYQIIANNIIKTNNNNISNENSIADKGLSSQLDQFKILQMTQIEKKRKEILTKKESINNHKLFLKTISKSKFNKIWKNYCKLRKIS